ncbi:hypothetical protein E4U36_000820 [Claviceps purpurea]|nr:hypothetical protein E4U36_000820 [Claviceps purpurea]
MAVLVAYASSDDEDANTSQVSSPKLSPGQESRVKSSAPNQATTKKFQQFLHLKRQGTHFNSKLESSTALRNPSLTDKLLSFVDVTGPAQYETTVSLDLYDPTSFPAYAHREKLRKNREVLVKEREGEKVTARGVDFVSASGMSTPVGGEGFV